jgi:CSLREA domain-containing protein
VTRRLRVAVAIGALSIACTPALGRAAGSASAAPSFTVDSTADAPDAKVGDGSCASTAKGGRCTLRAAVQEADTAATSTVIVPAGRYRLSIPIVAAEQFAGASNAVDGAAGDLDINQSMTIRGAGAARTIIDGAGLDRVFAIGNRGSGHLSDMTITGGDPSQAATNQGIALGGAIFNSGAITLDRMALVGNRADGGGGMFSIPGTHPIIRDTLIAGNRAYSGGGLRLDAGATIINSTITGNSLLELPASSEAFPRRPWPTTFALAVDEGSGWGGGIDNRGGGDVVILNSTITNNHAIKGGGGIAAGQGYAPVSDTVALGVMTLQNTIVSGNNSTAGPAGCHVKDQVIRSLGHNLASDDSCFLTAAGDHPNANPRLGRLAYNGGPTRTQALLPGSPALSAAVRCPSHDQRGFARPVGKPCDIGAFEDASR